MEGIRRLRLATQHALEFLSLHAGNLPEGMQVVNLLLVGTLLPEGSNVSTLLF
jgi:hypothetical protein